jgi:hypothetical protein
MRKKLNIAMFGGKAPITPDFADVGQLMCIAEAMLKSHDEGRKVLRSDYV